jgi:hypothetical protein
VNPTSTPTYVCLWSQEDVDRVMGEASRVLEGSLEARRPYMSKQNQIAADARIKLLHGTWTVLLDEAPEQ